MTPKYKDENIIYALLIWVILEIQIILQKNS